MVSFLSKVDGERLEEPVLIDSEPMESEELEDFEDGRPAVLYLVRLTRWVEHYDNYDRFAGHDCIGESYRIVDDEQLGDLSVCCGESEGLETYTVIAEFPASDRAEIADAFRVEES